jgi:MFS family permease
MLRMLLQLPRTVWLLAFVSFFNDTASELVYPLVPLYLAAVLQSGPRTLGIIEGIAEATGSLLKLFAGVMADRSRTTKHWVIGGYALSAVSRPLLAFAASWPMLLALRFADRVGKGLRASPRDAMLARTIAPDQRGIAFGFHRAMDNLGAVVGPLLAAVLLAAKVPLRDVFLWASLGGLAAVAGAMMVREPHRESAAVQPVFAWTLVGLPPVFRRYLVVLALFTLGNSSNMFLLLRARELGLSEAQVPLLWALVALTASIFSTPLSALSDRWGRRRLIIAGWIVYAAFYLLLTTINLALTALLWPLFAVYGLFMALTEGAEKAFVADVTPHENLGTAFGWFNLTSGLLLLPASLVFGVIWEQLGPEAAFGFSATCAGLAAVLMMWWVKGGEA